MRDHVGGQAASPEVERREDDSGNRCQQRRSSAPEGEVGKGEGRQGEQGGCSAAAGEHRLAFDGIAAIEQLLDDAGGRRRADEHPGRQGAQPRDAGFEAGKAERVHEPKTDGRGHVKQCRGSQDSSQQTRPGEGNGPDRSKRKALPEKDDAEDRGGERPERSLAGDARRGRRHGPRDPKRQNRDERRPRQRDEQADSDRGAIHVRAPPCRVMGAPRRMIELRRAGDARGRRARPR